MAVPLRTRTIWPIVALAACALALPTNAGARGGPRDEGSVKPAGSPHGVKGRETKSRAPSHGQSQSRGKSRSRGRSRGHGQPRSRGRSQSRGQSRSHGRSHSHGSGSPARPAARSSDSKPSTKGVVKSGPKDRPAGKVTICHATGSSTNPYVEITVSENALKAHRAHQHGEDLVGVPAGGCPGGKAAAGAAGTNVHEHGKVTLCHATGSDTNPFVTITIALPALAAHTRHQHGEDVVGTDGVCPGARVAARIAVDAAPAVTPPASGSAASGGAAGPRPRIATPVANPASARSVAGVSDESGAASPAAARTGDRRDSGSLPFTGFGLLLLLLLGTGSLLAGMSIRRSSSRPN